VSKAVDLLDEPNAEYRTEPGVERARHPDAGDPALIPAV